MEINKKHIVITGANRGIGLAIAKICAVEGAYLHLVTRQENPGMVNELKSLGAVDVKLWMSDLSQPAQVERLLLGLREVPVDILINNAGLLTGGLIENQDMSEISAMFQVNVVSLIQLTRGLLPEMLKRGSGKIVNNASVSAVMHFPCASTYAASKAAVLAFTNCLEIELNGTGVSTLALITPGIKTRMFDEIEVKYGSNFEVPTESISAEEYAQQIKQAILLDHAVLMPKGMTAVGLGISKYLPGLFKREAKRRFHR